MTLPANTTLGDARVWVEDGKKTAKGVTCPCCEQHVKIYKYTFNWIMGLSIVWLSVTTEKSKTGWVHVPTEAPPIIIRGRVFDKLKRWGLAIDRINDDTLKRCSGFWKTTKQGDDFANGRIMVPAYALLFNGKVEGFSDIKIDINKAVEKNFDYSAMME